MERGIVVNLSRELRKKEVGHQHLSYVSLPLLSSLYQEIHKQKRCLEHPFFFSFATSWYLAFNKTIESAAP